MFEDNCDIEVLKYEYDPMNHAQNWVSYVYYMMLPLKHICKSTICIIQQIEIQ